MTYEHNPIAEQLDAVLQLLTRRLHEPHIPGPKEKDHLDKALYHLIKARDLRDFAPDEEAVWNCGRIEIGGVERGGWEVVLRPTNSSSPSTD